MPTALPGTEPLTLRTTSLPRRAIACLTYFKVDYNMTSQQGFDRLYRYRLDHFDPIGEPAEAAAP